MKSILYILTVGLLFSCGAGDGASIDASIVKNNYSAIEDYESVTGGPKMIFNETEYEFPPMIKGDELEHAFYFVNAGDAPLVLTNVKGSCGCTNVEYKEDPILPGEKGRILAEVTTANKTAGKQFRVSVTIESNSLDQKIKLWLKGTPKAE